MDIVLMVIGAVWLLGGVPLYLLVAHRERQQTKRSADIAVRRAQQERLRRLARLPHERDGQ